MTPSISIVIVNYRTPKQIRICMRSLRHFTRYPCETIVVDNDANDESSEYLRSLNWIKYLENNRPEPTHRNGLDLGIQHSDADYVLTMHSDVFVRSHDWLNQLVSYINQDTVIVGSQDRLILPLPWLLSFDDYRRRRKLENKWKKKEQIPKIISHCVLYRRDLFTQHEQRFDWPEYVDGKYNDCGELIQRYCEQHEMGIVYLKRKDLAPYLWHFEGATLNVVIDRKLPFKRRFRSWRFYRRPEIRNLLTRTVLDQ